MNTIMNFPLALNAVLGSVLIVVLILIDYLRKYTGDRVQRNIFCFLLFFTLFPMMCDLAFFLIEKMPGKAVYALLWGLRSVSYLFQITACCYIIVFADYMVFKSAERSKKITGVIYSAIFLQAVFLVINLSGHFYFHINPADNSFSPGGYSRFFLGSVPVLVAVWDLFLLRKSFKKNILPMLCALLGCPVFGLIMDAFSVTAILVWPCFAAALLYAYFFIIEMDTRIDSLTGIGNRYAFNEFTDRLSRHNSGEAWAIVMLDMDHFKQINDSLGHQEGDNALRDMAGIIKNCLRNSDFAARYGGDEFVLATRVENGIVKLMRDIQEAIDRQNQKNSRPFKIEISYGYDVYTADGSRSIDDFLSHIDGLMYKHKEERRRASDRQSGAVQ